MSANYNIIQGGSIFNLNISNENIKLNNNTIRLVCDSTSGSIIINLPKISDTPNIDFTIYIDDFGDMASTNNITIICDPSDTIDNAPNYVIANNGQKVQIYISSISEYGVFQNANSSIPAYIPAIGVTYAQLLALKNANTLVVGQKYLITDFQTVHIIPNTVVVNMGSIEPIIVTASAINSINSEAMSTLYPQDIITYELVDSTAIGGTKGRITYRKDLIRNISIYYDWRVVLYRRWETAPASGFFTVITDNGNSFQDYTTFPVISPFPFPCANIEIAKCIFFPTQIERLNNVVFQSFTEAFKCDTGYFIDSTFRFIAQSVDIDCNSWFYSNTFDLFVQNKVSRSYFYNNNLPMGGVAANLFFANFNSNTLSNGFAFGFGGNTVNSNFYNNIFEGGYINYNVFNMDSNQNTFKGRFEYNMVNGNGSGASSYFYGNVFETGKSFINNDISGRFTLNTMNVDFFVNTIWRDFSSNTFNTPSRCSGNKFFNTFNQNTIVSNVSYVSSLYDNTITAQCIGNTFDNVTSSNTISGIFFNGNILLDNFVQNEIVGNFSGNTCGSSFIGNEISDMNNCTIGNGFSANIVKSIQFDTNIIGSSFSKNLIQGESFNNNNISFGFYRNIINSNVLSSTFGGNFSNNSIECSSFTGNNVGFDNFSYCDIRKSVGSFNGNTIPYSTFTTWVNTTSFNSNNVTGFFVNITFDGASITSSTIDNLSSLSTGTYSKKVSQRSDGVNRLTYIDATDTVIYKNPLLP